MLHWLYSYVLIICHFLVTVGDDRCEKAPLSKTDRDPARFVSGHTFRPDVLFYRQSICSRSYVRGIDGCVQFTHRSHYIIRDIGVKILDNSFAKQLSAFPASYQAALTDLHNRHPNWIFTALRTGYDWNVVLNNQEGKNALWYSCLLYT